MVQQRDLAQQFVAIYNDLDHYMRKKLHAATYVDHGQLLREMAEKQLIFKEHVTELRLFSEIRNLIVHNPYPNINPIFFPHKALVERYREILNKIKHPPKAMSIAIPASTIFTVKLKDKVHDVLDVMIKKTYTYVPVMDDGKFIGVFSESVLACYYGENKDFIMGKEALVEDFKEFLPFEKHSNEFFVFVPRNSLLSDVLDIFQKNLKVRKRVAVVYVTETGKKEEKLLGMITAWDIAGLEA